jgi:hypothetical protein
MDNSQRAFPGVTSWWLKGDSSEFQVIIASKGWHQETDYHCFTWKTKFFSECFWKLWGKKTYLKNHGFSMFSLWNMIHFDSFQPIPVLGLTGDGHIPSHASRDVITLQISSGHENIDIYVIIICAWFLFRYTILYYIHHRLWTKIGYLCQ